MNWLTFRQQNDSVKRSALLGLGAAVTLGLSTAALLMPAEAAAEENNPCPGAYTASLFLNEDCIGGPYPIGSGEWVSPLGFAPKSVWVY